MFNSIVNIFLLLVCLPLNFHSYVVQGVEVFCAVFVKARNMTSITSRAKFVLRPRAAGMTRLHTVFYGVSGSYLSVACQLYGHCMIK